MAEEKIKGFETMTSWEMDRQLMIRALAVQSLESPGFEAACRKIAVKLQGEGLFDEFMRLMADLFE